jgi:putative nucleotide binding protein
MIEIKKEAIVLDRATKEIQFKQTPIIQCIGVTNFSLLEMYSDETPKLQETISTEDKPIKRITYDKLTTIAKKELEKAIETIVSNNQERFVNFFNNARPINARRHQLDLLPMIGKKHRMALIEYLEKNGPFKTFEDLKKIELFPDPAKIIVNRVLIEIENNEEEKYFLFTIPIIKKF